MIIVLFVRFNESGCLRRPVVEIHMLRIITSPRTLLQLNAKIVRRCVFSCSMRDLTFTYKWIDELTVKKMIKKCTQGNR